MADVLAFHSQVASVMEVLANAAVAEICKLVDEGFALLRWEVSQKEKENEELRRRIGAMEKKEMVGMEEEAPDAPLFHQERPREEPRRKENLQIQKDRAVQSPPGGRERNAFADKQTSPTKSTEEAGDELRSRRTLWEVSGSEAVLKAEPEMEGANRRPLLVASECRAEQGNQKCGRSRLRGASSSPGGADTGDRCGSGPADVDAGGLRPAAATHTETLNSLPSVGAAHVKAEVESVDPAAVKLEADETKSREGHTPAGFYNEDGDAEEAPPAGITSVCPPHTQLVARGSEAHQTPWEDVPVPRSAAFPPAGSPQGDDPVHRGFICKHCGRSFWHLQQFEDHQRLHRGGKALSCIHCGKQFTQLCNLRVHLSVHAGRRPFPCAQCGKSFMSSRDLKVHQNVHTGERPFCCTMCGRSFSHPSNLKRHQKRSSPKKCILSSK